MQKASVSRKGEIYEFDIFSVVRFAPWMFLHDPLHLLMFSFQSEYRQFYARGICCDVKKDVDTPHMSSTWSLDVCRPFLMLALLVLQLEPSVVASFDCEPMSMMGHSPQTPQEVYPNTKGG